jgi:xanthine dehydrogenase YagS FAD-binding subunit
MNKFSWYDAKSVTEAVAQANSTVSEAMDKQDDNAAVYKSGGIDLLDLMKEGLVMPKKIVNVRNIAGLDKISYDKKTGLRIGANVTLAQMEKSAEIREMYYALHQASAKAATPNLRNVASLGGNLAQRTRCWYYRSIDHDCFRKGSGTCFARTGENEFHAIMKNGACTSVHASSIATALLAFNASVAITGAGGTKVVHMDDFFVLPGDDSRKETILGTNDLITAVILPPAGKKTVSYYVKQGARESHDWPIADVAVVMDVAGTTCKEAVVVLGAAAPVPIKSKAAAAAMIGKTISEANAVAAGEAAMQNATPLEQNAYKVPLFKAIVKRAIMATV